MAKVSTKPPSGMRDFLPQDLARRNHVISVIRDVYEHYGFQPLETPSLENLDVLLGKYGEDEKLIYRVLHRGDTLKRALESSPTEASLADQALRYDLTVPLARVVAQYGQRLPKYFKRYQIQPVWRADRPGKGRFREFYQCDVDALGTESLLAEAEVTSAVAEVLNRLGFQDFVIEINHRAVLQGLIRAAGVESGQATGALVAVDKLGKIGRQGVHGELVQRGIESSAAEQLLQLLDRGTVEALREVLTADEDASAALQQIEELLHLLQHTAADGKARFAPQLARGLGYYTGPIFEITLGDAGFSVAGGGRYDELVGMFGKQRIPAVGFSIGLERILVVMEERDMYPPLQVGPQVLLCWMDVERAQVLRIAAQLRAQGLRVEVFPEQAKLGKQLQYADSEGVKAPFAVIVGRDELEAGEVTLKLLATGDQHRVPLPLVHQRVAERMLSRVG